MAEMVAVLGLPLEFLHCTETLYKYFDDVGVWNSAIDLPGISLEKSEQQLNGENKASFLDLVRGMLRWVPEERETAKQLLGHPWLKKCRQTPSQPS